MKFILPIDKKRKIHTAKVKAAWYQRRKLTLTQEQTIDSQIDQAIEDRQHNHMGVGR